MEGEAEGRCTPSVTAGAGQAPAPTSGHGVTGRPAKHRVTRASSADRTTELDWVAGAADR